MLWPATLKTRGSIGSILLLIDASAVPENPKRRRDVLNFVLVLFFRFEDDLATESIAHDFANFKAVPVALPLLLVISNHLLS